MPPLPQQLFSPLLVVPHTGQKPTVLVAALVDNDVVMVVAVDSVLPARYEMVQQNRIIHYRHIHTYIHTYTRMRSVSHQLTPAGRNAVLPCMIKLLRRSALPLPRAALSTATFFVTFGGATNRTISGARGGHHRSCELCVTNKEKMVERCRMSIYVGRWTRI